ncbi:MAG: hypothetical protein JJ896_11830 [Rhodothermales bacterium]|nr:hypothetical protein [Rhodothermales bacterium]MBO6780334.1 hypothetical protein [Rhodothermales bacterium]
MRRFRAIASISLLASLLLGTLVAPLAHLGWMEMGGMEMTAMSHSMDMESAAEDGDFFSPFEECIEECPYLQLLQTQSPGLADLAARDRGAEAVEKEFSEQGRQDDGRLDRTIRPRGPPAVA